MAHQVTIIGGGFAGIACALRLARFKIKNLNIRVISDNANFEYHAALYRVVTGKSPMEVCLPLHEIFASYPNIEYVDDRISNIDLDNKTLSGTSQSEYEFDYLILALGSQTSYYKIPGLDKHAFGFKTIHEAIKLKHHIQELFKFASNEDKDTILDDMRIVVVGGGPSGTELAGELAVYTHKLAQTYRINPTLISIDLIQSPNRLIPQSTQSLSKAVESKLRQLGVNLYLNRKVLKEDVEQVYLKDLKMESRTLIWTAGTQPNVLYSQIPNLQLSKSGKAQVNSHFQATNYKHVYVAGDGAEVGDSGLGQSAIAHGKHIANHIKSQITKSPTPKHYTPHNWLMAVPVGPQWAAVEYNKIVITGRLGWWLRRLLDFKVFTEFLPLPKAFQAFKAGTVQWESGL